MKLKGGKILFLKNTLLFLKKKGDYQCSQELKPYYHIPILSYLGVIKFF